MIIISLGAGVQSSTMLLMSERGDLPRADHAIFADTGWEPPSVYRWLDWLEQQTTIPVHRVKGVGSAREHALGQAGSRAVDGRRFSSLPLFIRRADGGTGRGSRQCTRDLKLDPMSRGRPGPREVIVEQWIGISLDEVQRMKPSRCRWIRHVWPLVDLVNPPMRRSDCLRWWSDRGLPEPPRSACIGCPFHSDEEWRRLRDEEPEAFADAVEVDRLLRERGDAREGVLRGDAYLHRSLIPLGSVDLRSADTKNGQLPLWGEECEGMCGL